MTNTLGGIILFGFAMIILAKPTTAHAGQADDALHVFYECRDWLQAHEAKGDHGQNDPSDMKSDWQKSWTDKDRSIKINYSRKNPKGVAKNMEATEAGARCAFRSIGHWDVDALLNELAATPEFKLNKLLPFKNGAVSRSYHYCKDEKAELILSIVTHKEWQNWDASISDAIPDDNVCASSDELSAWAIFEKYCLKPLEAGELDQPNDISPTASYKNDGDTYSVYHIGNDETTLSVYDGRRLGDTKVPKRCHVSETLDVLKLRQDFSDWSDGVQTLKNYHSHSPTMMPAPQLGDQVALRSAAGQKPQIEVWFEENTLGSIASVGARELLATHTPENGDQ